MKTHDFLLELGTEELPPKLLLKLSESLKNNIADELKKINISSSSIVSFATPRRLAVSITELRYPKAFSCIYYRATKQTKRPSYRKKRPFNRISRNGD